MIQLSLYRIIIPVIVAALLAGGCGTTKPSRFYTLTTFAEKDLTPDVQTDTQMGVIGVGPIRIAHYLDRPQIVTRIGPNRFEIAEFDRWGGTLQDDFTRALAENLTTILPGEPIARSPWGRSTVIAYQIPVDLIHFDGELGQAVQLIAQWQILSDGGSQQLVSRRSSISRSVEGPSYDDLVAAQSRLVVELAQEIARELKSMKPQAQAQ